MSTVIAVTDRGEWGSNTDNIAVVEPERRCVRWVPRDLWSELIGNRVNKAFALGRHDCLQSVLREQGLDAHHGVCVRREAVERALSGLTVTVPVPERMDFWYPLEPQLLLQDGRKRISFTPPAEVLSGERIHQWLGARRRVTPHPAGVPGDLDRIARQQVFVRRLLEDGFDFAGVVADGRFASVTDAEALREVGQVEADWRHETVDDVDAAMKDGKAVLVRTGPPAGGS